MGQARTSKNSGSRNGRVIMHLDMDAFFVNVELLENPALRGEPIIVAPLGPRSVVCSAAQSGVFEEFDVDEEGVHVQVHNDAAVPYAAILAGSRLPHVASSHNFYAHLPKI